MKRIRTWAAITLMIAGTITGCGTSDDLEGSNIGPENEQPEPTPERPTYIELTRSETELVNGSNDFAFNLFRELTKNDGTTIEEGNTESDSQDFSNNPSLIISPISITYALGMLNNGAAGETLSQINEVLGFGTAGADGINDFCRKMLTTAPALDPLTKVIIANTIFMNKGYELKSDFTKKAKEFYDAEPETRDFHDGQTMNVINQWASDHTEKMIEKVLNEDTFTPDAVSYLLNAIYFKGSWRKVYEFDKNETKNETFTANGIETQVPMMHHAEEKYQYTENDLCQALSIPYGSGAYKMTILLPRENKSVQDVLQTLTADSWKQQYTWMDDAYADVKLPRFETDTDIKLNDIMSVLGMPDAFDKEKAKFPEFCNRETYIGLMKQVAKIKVSEEGTEASAVTVIGMDMTALPIEKEPKHVTFHATRPFLYVISERTTGAIFFIGKYTGK